MASHLLDALRAIGISDKLSLNSSVLELAGTAVQVPGVSDHELEVVVLVDRRAHILVVVLELRQGHLVVADVSIPLSHELSQDVIAAHLTRLELGVLGDVVCNRDVVQVDHAAVISIQLVVGKLDKRQSTLVHIAADATEELIVGDLTVVVLVKVFKDALELRGAEGVAVLAKSPHELVAIHLLVAIVVHAAENDSETTDTVSATGFHSVQNLLKDLIGGFTLDSENWVDVGVVAATTDGEPCGELLVVQLVVAVLVVLVEDGSLLELREGATDALESPGEL